jgi:hypothetical protein
MWHSLSAVYHTTSHSISRRREPSVKKAWILGFEIKKFPDLGRQLGASPPLGRLPRVIMTVAAQQ